MTQIKCPECGNEISSVAKTCPNCGFPLLEGKTENCAHYESEPKFNDSPSPNLSKSDVSRHSNCGSESVSSKFRCPECGQEVSQTLSTCPNCGFPLIENESEKSTGEQKSQVEDTLCPNIKDSGDARSNLEEQKTQPAPSPKTAADIINEHKQKEDDLREIIRKKYNIVGDISDEQYKQLIEIFKQEVGEITLNEKKKEGKNNHGKIILTGGIIGIIVCLLAILILNFNIGGFFTKAQNIRTADQWVEYCSNEPNIHRCLKVFDKLDMTTKCLIWDELTNMVAHLRFDDEKQGVKSDAWIYLNIYMVEHETFREKLERQGKLNTFESRAATVVVASGRVDAIIERYNNE